MKAGCCVESGPDVGTMTSLCKFGAQVGPGVILAIRGYRRARGDGVPLSGLTDRNFDHPGTQNLRACQMLGEMLELILLDSGVDPGWN